MTTHPTGRALRRLALLSGSAALAGGLLTMPAAQAAIPRGDAPHSLTTAAGPAQHLAKPKHCHLVVGDPYKSGKHVKANARYYCKKRGNLTMRLELTRKAKKTYRAGHSWRMNRTVSGTMGKGCTTYQLRVRAAEYNDQGGYMDLLATGHSHWKKLCR